MSKLNEASAVYLDGANIDKAAIRTLWGSLTPAYDTRADFISGIASAKHNADPDGLIVVAEGQSYARSTGSTSIPDIANYIPHGFHVTPEHFGCNPGDAASLKVKNALDYANLAGKPLLAGSGDYASTVTLRVADNTSIIGTPETVFSFVDVHGFDTDVADLVSGVNFVGKFKIKGSANKSTLATVTNGLKVGPARDWSFDDIKIEDFVIHAEFDPINTGLISMNGSLHCLATFWPNGINGSPDKGISLVSTGTKKMQTSTLKVKVYSQLTAQKFSGTVAAGKTADITLPLPLYQYVNAADNTARGIAVWIIDAVTGFKTQTSDFTLDDMTTGSPVAIASAWVNPWVPSANPNDAFPATPTALRVTFGAGIAVGIDYEILYNDPWGNKGISVVKGTENNFTGEVGGWDELINVQDVQNTFEMGYFQSGYTGFVIGAAADDTVAIVKPVNNTVAQTYDIDAGAERSLVSPYQGGAINIELNTLNHTGTTAWTALSGPGSGIITTRDRYQTKWKATIDLHLENTGATAVDVRLQIMRSKNDVAAVSIGERTITIPAGAHLPLFYTAFDSNVQEIKQGIVDKHEYHAEIKLAAAGDTITVNSGGSFTSRLIVDRIPAY